METNLKILLFVEEFLPSTETFIYNQLRELSKNHRIRVICFSRINEELFPFPDIQCITSQNVLLSKLTGYFRSRLIFPWFRDTKLSMSLQKHLIDFEPDLLLTHFGLNALILWKSLPSKYPPLIYFMHGYDASLLLQQSNSYRGEMSKFLNQKSSYPVFVCNALRKNMQDKLKITIRGPILHMGIDTDFFSRENPFPRNDEIRLIQVAGFTEKKGQELAIRAFYHWGNRQAKLLFIGDGPTRKTCELLTQKLGISERVHFLGRQDPKTVKKYLENSHAFLHPSRTSGKGDMEGIPTSIMEAMSMKLPVLSSFHSGIPELVDDKINGYLVEENDYQALSDKFDKAFEMGELEINRNKIDNQFNVRRQAGKLEDLMENILSSTA